MVATDINNDGRMDLFVANDTVQNFLFVNRGPDAKGKTQWEEIALAAEVGFSDDGRARSGMGVDAADFDGDGWQDLFVANVDQEMFSLYKNNKNETFRDVAFKNEVAQATRLLSGWGLRFFDYDNDGALDLFLANGHPDDMIDNYSPGGEVQGAAAAVPPGERATAQRERRSRTGLCQDVSRARPGHRRFQQRRPGRRADRQQRRRRRCCCATTPAQGNHWLGVKLEGVKCNRDAVGARLTWSAGGVERIAPEEQRRQLSFLARSARGAGAGTGGETRLAGNPMAAAQRAHGTVHGPEGGFVRAHC